MARTSRTHSPAAAPVPERRNSRSRHQLDEAALAQTEQRLRALLEHGADAIVLFDADGVMRYVSPSTKRVLGYEPDELIGRSRFELYHPDDAPRMREVIADLLKRPGGRAAAEVRLRHKDGTWRWIEGKATNLLHDSSVQAIVVNYRDTSERKAADEARRRLAAIVESSDDAIVSVSLDGIVQTWNAGAQRIYLYSADEMIGRSVAVLAPPGVPPVVVQHRERLHRGESLRLETVRLRKDGTPITVSLTLSPVRDESGRVIAVATVSRDASDRKRAEIELRRRAAHLEALNEIVSQAVAAPDLTQLVGTALATIMKTLACEMGAVWVLDARIARGLPAGASHVLFDPLLDRDREGPPGPIVVEDWRVRGSGDGATGATIVRLGVRASLVAPIPAEGRSLGGILVASSQPRAWLPDEIRLVESVGKQVGSAVERLRLFRDAQQHTLLMARLVSIMETLNRSLVASEAVVAIGEGALGLCAADRAAVFVRQPDGTVICPWSLGLSADFVAQVLAHQKELVVGRLAGEPATTRASVIDGRTVDTDKPFLFSDTLAYPEGSRSRVLADREGIRATGFLPLAYEGRVIAVVVCYYDVPRVWTEPEHEVFLSFCWQAAIALQNAGLREGQAQRAAALEVLADVSNRLRASQTPEEMYPILVEQSMALFNGAQCSLALLDQPGRQLTRVYTTGFGEPAGSTFPVEGSLAGPVVTSGVAWVTADLPPQATKFVHPEATRHIGPLAIVPVRSEQEVIGTLALGRVRAPGSTPFTDTEVRLLQAIAEIGGTAIRRARLYDNLEQSYIQMVLALARTVDARDTYTSGHSERIAVLAEHVARAIGCEPEEIQDIRWAALLHDIGKVGVPDDILRKPGTLTQKEWDVMRQHPVIGESILVSTDRMRGVARIVRHHQERWDGTGYPDGLQGEEIPTGARILAVVDAYSAITDSRPYKAARSHEEAIAELLRCSGSQFDPRVVHVFCQIVEPQT